MKNETFVIAEIGINHNGSLKIAKDLILMAKAAGCNAVKFQKRDINTVYTEEELNKPGKARGVILRENKKKV
jgi:Sialic acid synthase